jgi:xanthine/uracil/vitamin C permease (AzgA family)
MTWDQAVTWVIVSDVITVLLTVGGVWLSRYMP